MSGSRFGFYVLMVLTAAGGGIAAVLGIWAVAAVLIFSGGIGILWVVADTLWVQRNEDLYNRERLVRTRTSSLVTLSQTDPETRRLRVTVLRKSFRFREVFQVSCSTFQVVRKRET